ncbi:hypothetical protein BKA81DRAFT_352503 [Phyllosticta paracitricarpa]
MRRLLPRGAPWGGRPPSQLRLGSHRPGSQMYLGSNKLAVLSQLRLTSCHSN